MHHAISHASAHAGAAWPSCQAAPCTRPALCLRPAAWQGAGPAAARPAPPAWHRQRSRRPHAPRAAAPEVLVTEEGAEQQQQQQQQPSVEFLGVLRDMQTVRGVLDTTAHPDLVYSILSDYDSCPRVFRNISGSRTLLLESGGKQVVQACKWQFLAFKGTFDVAMNVTEQPGERLLVFTLAESSFMRDFEGRWQVEALPDGGSRIQHVLAVKPLVSIPPAIAPYTSSIFKQQVAALLRDLADEIDRQAAAAAAATGASEN